MGGSNMDSKDFEHLANEQVDNNNTPVENNSIPEDNSVPENNSVPEGCCGGCCGCSCRVSADDYEGEIAVGGLMIKIAEGLTLQDIANYYIPFPEHLISSFKEGSTQIWFKRIQNDEKANMVIDLTDLNKTHAFLGSIAEKSLYMIGMAFTISGWLGGFFSVGSLHDMFLKHKGTDHYEIQSGDIAIVDGSVYVLYKDSKTERWDKIS